MPLFHFGVTQLHFLGSRQYLDLSTLVYMIRSNFVPTVNCNWRTWNLIMSAACFIKLSMLLGVKRISLLMLGCSMPLVSVYSHSLSRKSWRLRVLLTVSDSHIARLSPTLFAYYLYLKHHKSTSNDCMILINAQPLSECMYSIFGYLLH